MQQDPASTSPVAAAATSAPAADPAAMPGAGFAGDSDADALSQMGFANLWHEMTSDPGEFMVSWVVLLTLILMSVGSWYYTVVNLLKNSVIRARADRVISTFWETQNPQDSLNFMEQQPKGEPFSKIALDAAQAALHHSKHEGSRLVEALNRSEFIDRALRQAVTRESAKLENGLTWLATVGSTAPFVGLLGTVWGIYGALIRIGATGQASIDAVAGPGRRGADHDRHRSVRRHPGGAGVQLLRAHEPQHQCQVRYLRARPARLLRHRLARRRSGREALRPG
jgi:biopolymer transport protein ExbB